MAQKGPTLALGARRGPSQRRGRVQNAPRGQVGVLGLEPGDRRGPTRMFRRCRWMRDRQAEDSGSLSRGRSHFGRSGWSGERP